MRNKVIHIISPESVRGGGFLKYCDLLSQGYTPHKSWDSRRPDGGQKRTTLERSMHARFCIDFPTYAKVVYQINMYVEAHFRSGKKDLLRFFNTILRIVNKLYQQSTPHSYEMMRWVYHIMCLYFGQPMRRPQQFGGQQHMVHQQHAPPQIPLRMVPLSQPPMYHTTPPVIQQEAAMFTMVPNMWPVAAPAAAPLTLALSPVENNELRATAALWTRDPRIRDLPARPPQNRRHPRKQSSAHSPRNAPPDFRQGTERRKSSNRKVLAATRQHSGPRHAAHPRYNTAHDHRNNRSGADARLHLRSERASKSASMQSRAKPGKQRRSRKNSQSKEKSFHHVTPRGEDLGAALRQATRQAPSITTTN